MRSSDHPWNGAGPCERLGRLAATTLPLPPDDGGRSFAAFLAASRTRRRARPLPLALAVAVHAALLVYGVVTAFWKVDEVHPPPLMIVMHSLPPMPPPAGGGRKAEDPPPAKVPPKNPARAVFPVRPDKKIAAATADGDKKAPNDQPPGDASTCPPGMVCNGTEPTAPPPPPLAIAPPDVAAKSCLECPQPHLPPAYRRLGIKQSILVRICADRSGQVTRTQVLRGIDPAADEDVTRTLSGWRFSPYKVSGNPVPFCYVSNFVFTTE